METGGAVVELGLSLREFKIRITNHTNWPKWFNIDYSTPSVYTTIYQVKSHKVGFREGKAIHKPYPYLLEVERLFSKEPQPKWSKWKY